MQRAHLQFCGAGIVKVGDNRRVAGKGAGAGVDIDEIGANCLDRGEINRAIGAAHFHALHRIGGARRLPVAHVPPGPGTADDGNQHHQPRQPQAEPAPARLPLPACAPAQLSCHEDVRPFLKRPAAIKIMLERTQAPLAANVQDANQRKQPAGGGKVGFHLALQPFQQQFRRLVVNAAPGHVDGFDLGGGGFANRLIIAVADGEIVADRAAEPAQPQHQRLQQLATLAGNMELQPAIRHRKPQPIRPLVPRRIGTGRFEAVVFDEIEDGDAPFLFNIGIAPQDCRFVELNMRDARVRHERPVSQMQRAGARGARNSPRYPQPSVADKPP